MRGSIQLGYIKGVSINVHVTFLLTIIWAGWQGLTQYGGLEGVAFSITAILLLFTCVLLHELGHALRAKARGIAVRYVMLLPIGGVAGLETPPREPMDELQIALAGPAVNLVLGVAMGGVVAGMIFPNTSDPLAMLSEALQMPSLLGLLVYLTVANFLLLFFNLIPAFPMDGGRVMRAGLAMFLPYDQATRGATLVGQIIAVGLMLIGLFGLRSFGILIGPNVMLFLVGLIVFMGARQEDRLVRWHTALTHLTVNDAFHPPTWTIGPSDLITDTMINGIFKYQPVLPVLVGARLVGLLTRKDAKKALKREDRAIVAHVMRTDFPVVRPSDPLWVAYETLQSHKLAGVPVINGGNISGIIGIKDVNQAARLPIPPPSLRRPQ